MANGGRIDYTIGFNVDKSGLNELQKQLDNLLKTTPSMLDKMNPGVFKNIKSDASSTLYYIKKDLREVQAAFKDAFNPETGLMNLRKLNTSLNNIGIQKLSQDFKYLGKEGEQAFYQMTKSALTTNMQLKQSNTLLNKMGTTLMNTLKWTLSSGLINRITGALSQAVGYIEHLDSSLNDIRIVTKKSADEMDNFAVKANKAAQALGRATTDYTEAALIYYQQGLGDEEVQARAETTLKAANVTGQAASAVSEQLTAVWNGFRVNAEQTEEYVDKLAAVAAISASNLEELSTGMSKVASAAANLGVDIDQLTAQISTIVSVTRQAPESVGTALKTIYARISDLKLGESDEDGLGLGDVSGGLKKLGVEVLDSEGELRDLGTVIEEVAGKWDSWTSAQQAAIAQLMAGKRQYNNLVALFSNWDMYTNAIETSRNATGELQKQQDIYMESAEAHLQQMKTQWENLYDSILDENAIKGFADSITSVLKLLTNFVDGIGGGRNVLLLLSSTLTRVFSKQLSQGITNLISGFSRIKENAAQLKAQIDNIQLFKNTQQYDTMPTVRALVDAQRAVSQYYGVLSNEQINTANALAQQVGEAAQLEQEWKDNAQAVNEYIQAVQNGQKNIKVNLNNGSTTTADYRKFDFAKGSAGLNQIKGIEQSLDKSENKLKKFGEQLNELSKKFTVVEKDSSKFDKNIQTIQRTAENASKNFKELNKQGLFKNVEPSKLREIERSLSDIQKAGNKDEFAKAMQKLEASMEGLEPAAKIAIQSLRQMIEVGNSVDFSAPSKQLDEFLKKAALQQFINNIVNTIGAVGQFSGSINSLRHSFDVLGDSSLSTGEKITQFISSIGMAIPMLISSSARLVNGYKALNGIMNTMNATKKATIIANSKIYASNGMLTKQGLALIGIDYKKLTAEELLTAETDRHNKELAEQALLQKTLNPLLLAGTAIIAGLTIAISSAISSYNNMREEMIKTADAATAEQKEIQEGIDKRKEEANGLQNLIDQYKKGEISTKEFNDQKLKLIGTIDEVSDSISKQTDNWKAAQKGLDDYKASLAGLTISDQGVIRDAQMKKAIAEIDKDNNWTTIDKSTKALKVSFGDFAGDLSESNNPYISALRKAGFVNEKGQLAFTITPDEKGLEQLNKIIEIQRSFKGTDVQSSIQYNFMQELYDKYTQSNSYEEINAADKQIKDAEVTQAIAKAELNQKDSVEDLKASKQVFLDALKESSLTEKEQQQAWVDYLTNSSNDAAKILKEEEVNINHMLKQWLETKPEEIDLYTSKAYQKAGELQKKLTEKGFSSTEIGRVSEQDWSAIIFNGLDEINDSDIKAASIKIREASQKALNNGFNDFKNQAGKMENNLQTVIASAISGNVDTGVDSAYAKLKDNLEILKQYYPELSDEVAIFTNTGIIGTEKWINSAYTLQKAFNDLELSKKSDDLNDKIEDLANRFKEGYDDRGFELGIVPDTEEFTEAINEIMDEDYNITIEVGADIEDSFNNLVDGMEKADSMAAKIGENFIVSAEDITEIADAFPGILEGYTDLGNGTIQLNQEIAKSAMDAANQAEIASTEELVTEIKNTNTKLQVKKNHYDNIVKIAADAAKTEGNAEEEKSKIVKELQDIEKENQEILSQSKVDNAKAVADNSNKNAEVVGANWEEGYQKAADAAITEAQIAIENAKRIAEANRQAAQGGPVTQTAYGQGTSLVKGWTGGKQGVGGQIDTSSTQLKEQGDLTNKEYFTQIQEEAQKQSDLLEKEINANSAMAAEAAARLGKSVTSNNAVGSVKEDNKDSSKSSEKEAQHMDNIEREEDIYREINTELDNIESTLGRIDKVASHSWGEDYQQTLEEQNKLLDQQIEKLEQKKKMQKGDLSTRRKQLEDVGVKFSNDGSVMTNAEQVLNNLYAGYNAMVAKYNAMSASDQEAYKAQMETEKNRIDAIEKKIDEYESTYSDFQGTLDELLDKHYEAIENEVNKFNNKINVELELSDARREWNDFWKDVIADVSETDFGGQIAASLTQLKELIGLGTGDGGTVGKLSNHLMEITDQVWAQIRSADRGGEDSIFGDDTNLSKETLQEFINKTMTAVRDAEKEVDNIAENYLKTLESAKDLIDAQVDGYDAIGKHIEHNVNMIKLLDPEDYSALNTQYENQYENDLKLVQTQKASKEFWQEQMETHKQMRDSYEKGSKQWETYNKAYKESTQNYLDATEAFDTAMENALESAKEIADNLKEATFKQIDKGLSNNLGLDLLEEEWKLINEQADRYYDNVERYLSMEEYTNYLDDAANAIGLSAENQKKLNEFRDSELQKLNEKTKLQAYDIEESKARLEIMKAQMALEDAQRNKNNMRLRRDSQGNYNYQYVANDEAIEDAEKGVLTAKKEWYEIVKKQYKQTTDDILTESRRYYDLVKKWDEAKARGDEEAAAKYLELIKDQQKVLDQLYADSAKNQQDLFSGTAQYFAEVENAAILPQSEATVRTMVDQWVGGDDSFLGAVETGITELNRIQQKYVEDTDRVFKEAGEDYAGLRDQGIDPTKDALDDLVRSQGDLDDNLNQITEDLKDHATALDGAVEGYNNLKQAAADAIAQANSALETLAKTAIDAKTKVNEAVIAAQSASSINFNIATPSNGGGSNGGSGGGGGSNTPYANNTPYEITIADTAGGHTKHYSAFSKNDIYNAMAPYATGDYVQMWVTKDNMRADLTGSTSKEELRKRINGISFDTGGYTGSWNSNSGRLGILHQKELVLNASDTQNILSAVELLRALPFAALAQSIVDSSSNIAASFRTGTNMNGISGNTTNNETKSMVVNADFSGVRSADEIYQALLELENYGLQNSYSVAPHANSSY